MTIINVLKIFLTKKKQFYYTHTFWKIINIINVVFFSFSMYFYTYRFLYKTFYHFTFYKTFFFVRAYRSSRYWKIMYYKNKHSKLYVSVQNSKYQHLQALAKFKKHNSVLKTKFSKFKPIVRFLRKQTKFTPKKRHLFFDSMKLNYLYWRRVHNVKNYLSKFKKVKKRRAFSFKNQQGAEYRRFNRLIAAKHFFVKGTAQYALTRYLSKMDKTFYVRLLHSYEFKLKNLLIRSRLVFTYGLAEELIELGFVYVNGLATEKKNFQTKRYDIIQLAFFPEYFYFFNYHYCFLYKENFKFKYILWRKHRFKFSFYKEYTSTFPMRVGRSFFLKICPPRFLEINYFILTIHIIRYPKTFKEYSYFFLNDISILALRTYNWKYIT